MPHDLPIKVRLRAYLKLGFIKVRLRAQLKLGLTKFRLRAILKLGLTKFRLRAIFKLGLGLSLIGTSFAVEADLLSAALDSPSVAQL